jgi:hypothetical protein
LLKVTSGSGAVPVGAIPEELSDSLSLAVPESLAARLGLARERTVVTTLASAPDPTTAANATDPKTVEMSTDGDVSGTAACALIATSRRREMVSMVLERSSADQRWSTS